MMGSVSESSGESVYMGRLSCAFVDRQFDEYSFPDFGLNHAHVPANS